MNDDPSTRRSFLDLILGIGVIGWLGAVIYPVIQYLKVPPRAEIVENVVTAAKSKDVKPGQGMIFKFGNKPAILIRTKEGEFRAFSGVCTHLDCTVQYRVDLDRIWCACHNGTYDLNGKNVAGPPPRPLDSYKVFIKGEDVIVTKA
jgi:Rieske Fe-S protein